MSDKIEKKLAQREVEVKEDCRVTPLIQALRRYKEANQCTLCRHAASMICNKCEAERDVEKILLGVRNE